jgi:hypothetical protein
MPYQAKTCPVPQVELKKIYNPSKKVSKSEVAKKAGRPCYPFISVHQSIKGVR